MLFSGYRLRPDLTAAATEGDWFVTSDLGELKDGRLRVLGRADDVINTGGEKVVAGVVAEVLRAHPAVADVAVVGRPDPEWGEKVVAVAVPADPAAPPTLETLRALVKDRLPAHAAPKELLVLPRLPCSPTANPTCRRCGGRRDRDGHQGGGRPGPPSQEDLAAVLVDVVGHLVVQPEPAGREVPEPVGSRGQDHRDRAYAPAPGQQLVPAGLPPVEVAHHADHTRRMIEGQREGDAGLATEQPCTCEHEGRLPSGLSPPTLPPPRAHTCATRGA
ncbi:AMP-binding enzyme [Thermocatellispora tengchongensis]|uniref:AMP-binding enzyme n=1 Tax=Thermocatellispora tengchongensis TaxID=1073253 RepID=UPI0036340B1D